MDLPAGGTGRVWCGIGSPAFSGRTDRRGRVKKWIDCVGTAHASMGLDLPDPVRRAGCRDIGGAYTTVRARSQREWHPAS